MAIELSVGLEPLPPLAGWRAGVKGDVPLAGWVRHVPEDARRPRRVAEVAHVSEGRTSVKGAVPYVLEHAGAVPPAR